MTDDAVGALTSLYIAYISLVYVLHESGVVDRKTVAGALKGLAQELTAKPGYGLLTTIVEALEDDRSPEEMRKALLAEQFTVIDGGKSDD